MLDLTALQWLGSLLMDTFWVPVLLWTGVALPLMVLLQRMDSISPVYHYHSRVALQLALPLGIAGSLLFDWISGMASTAGTGSFIVIQNPISVTAVASETATASNLLDLPFWIGTLSIIAVAGACLWMVRLFLHYLALQKLEKELSFSALKQDDLLIKILPYTKSYAKRSLVAYSEEATVPFTYGWHQSKIVLPADLKADHKALAMAVQHELMHIKHHDFLLQGLLNLLRAIFWFHPLVHRLYTSAREYREITCDGEVLAVKNFSKKQYASLLVTLAQREHQTYSAMSMAVQQSTLKKRIKLMSSQNNLSNVFRSSFLITFASTCLFVLTISCTDMASDGITNSEVEQTQAQISSPSSPKESNQLYIVNGEEWDNNEESAMKLSRLKTKYIESIDVLKGENAVEEYGERASDGAIIMSVHNPGEAFSDLKNTTPAPPTNSTESTESDFFVAVEDMPELKDGLSGLMQKLKYPQEAREEGLEDQVIVQFIVSEQGAVENPQVIRGDYEVLNEEALRVVQEAEFEPGKQDGQAVRVQYSLPIAFQLASPED